LRILRATPADILRIRQLEQSAATAAHWNSLQYESLFSTDPLPRLIFVAADDSDVETIRGFLVARCLPDEWEVENVVVAERCQRSGIATSLIRELQAEARAKGVGSIMLEVRESNQPALRLYETIGFKRDGTRKDYYQFPTEDAILFRFVLQTCDKIS
jgi:ribosomal-protein-alanine N-acetyltransferase